MQLVSPRICSQVAFLIPRKRERWHGARDGELSGACHKHFRTLAQAEAFIADWAEMYAFMVKANIQKELLDAYRPAKTKGLPTEFTLKTGGSDEDELTDRLGRLKVKQS